MLLTFQEQNFTLPKYVPVFLSASRHLHFQAINTVVAGILHDVIDDAGENLQNVQDEFGEDVAKLVSSVSRLSYINQVRFFVHNCTGWKNVFYVSSNVVHGHGINRRNSSSNYFVSMDALCQVVSYGFIPSFLYFQIYLMQLLRRHRRTSVTRDFLSAKEVLS